MKQKLIVTAIAAAFAGTAGVAMAGPISVASVGTYAAETIGAAAGNITLGGVGYTLTNPFATNGSTQTVRFALSASSGTPKLATCPTLTFQYVTSVPPTNPPTITNLGLSTDATNCSYTVVTGAGTTSAVASGAILNFTGAAADKTAGPILAATPLVATVSVIDTNNSVIESNFTNVAQSAQALSAAWVSSSTVSTSGPFTTAEKSQVDVTATPVATAFTNPTDATNSTASIVLGAFQLINNTGTFLDSNGVATVDISKLTTNKWALTVTGPFVNNTKTAPGAVALATSSANCAAGTVLANSTFTIAGTTATLASFDAIAAALPTTSPQTVYVCYTPQASLTTKLTIPTGQFAGATTSATTAATAVTPTGMQGETASGNLYNLTSNGASVDVRVMTTSGTTGWSTVLRIINTGNISAPVTATYLNVDGTLGASGQLSAGLAPGAVMMMSSAQVEQALGTTLGNTGNPPRIRISAPTDALAVQAWINANGQWFMGTPAQDDNANKSGFTTGVSPR